eukprot:g21672.t1
MCRNMQYDCESDHVQIGAGKQSYQQIGNIAVIKGNNWEGICIYPLSYNCSPDGKKIRTNIPDISVLHSPRTRQLCPDGAESITSHVEHSQNSIITTIRKHHYNSNSCNFDEVNSARK